MSVYKNLPVLDLRKMSVEEARQIEKITNVAALLLPDDGDPELRSAIAAIPKKNVACVVPVPSQVPNSVRNGIYIGTKEDLSKDQILIVNGAGVISDCPAESRARFIVNGMMVRKKGTDLNILEINGLNVFFDFENVVTQLEGLEVDRDLLEFSENKTLFLSVDEMKISEDVSKELLLEKQPYFVSVAEIRCAKEISAYVRLHAQTMAGVEIFSGDENEDD